VSRSKDERIINKMVRSANSRVWRIKRGWVGTSGWEEWENTYAKQKYTPVSSRARGTKQYISFFLLIIGL
jgi:hypothetical protein